MMRKCLAVCFLLFAAFLAGAQQTAPLAQWTPPDVVISQAAAGAALMSYKASLEAEINSIATTVNGLSPQVTQLQQSMNALALTPTAITVRADAYSGFSGTAMNREWGVCAPAVDFSPGFAGQSADYPVTIPQAGNYLLLGCVASAVTGPVSFHFEYPPGTSLGSLSSTACASPLNNWSVFRYIAMTNPVALPAGPVTIRVVFETANFNWGGFTLTPQ
jgi:outer membrane murein-binding lipoprotein Lpp